MATQNTCPSRAIYRVNQIWIWYCQWIIRDIHLALEMMWIHPSDSGHVPLMSRDENISSRDVASLALNPTAS